MKTTIDISDSVFREAKASAAKRGRPLREFVQEALEEKLHREEGYGSRAGKWPVPPPDVPREELERIQAVIDEAHRVDAEAWT